jgi:membrane-associated HD superfamily phosphohydrolase
MKMTKNGKTYDGKRRKNFALNSSCKLVKTIFSIMNLYFNFKTRHFSSFSIILIFKALLPLTSSIFIGKTIFNRSSTFKKETFLRNCSLKKNSTLKSGFVPLYNLVCSFKFPVKVDVEE